MTNLNLIILSYHKFVETESEYRFSRTYDQFSHDIRKKVYDMITIDDGMSCQIRACEMMRELNIRAKLFVSSALIGTPGYCTWQEIRRLSPFHDIENHGHHHIKFSELSYLEMYEHIRDANTFIYEYTGRVPRFFVAPWNEYSKDIEKAAHMNNLQLMVDRENILNISK